MTGKEPHKTGAVTRLRNYFLTGLVVTAPLVITIYLIWSFVQWVDGWVIPYVPAIYNPSTYLPWQVPGIGLVIAGFVITIVGFLTANIMGRTIVAYGEDFVARMPVVRNIYNALKQIFQTVLTQDGFAFQKVGLIEFPRKGLWAIVFVASEKRSEIADKLENAGEETVGVFMPTTPNPTSGFLVYVPRRDLIVLDMSIEEGVKMVISAGLVAPDYNAKLAELAEGAKQKKRPRADKTFAAE
jgi:uncharacterized membrane protein